MHLLEDPGNRRLLGQRIAIIGNGRGLDLAGPTYSYSTVQGRSFATVNWNRRG